MHKTLLVNVSKGFECRREHVAWFGRREWPVSKNQRQVLLGVLHHDVEQLRVPQLAASRLKELDQVRMGKVRRQPPPGQLQFRVPSVRPNEFDRGRLKSSLTVS